MQFRRTVCTGNQSLVRPVAPRRMANLVAFSRAIQTPPQMNPSNAKPLDCEDKIVGVSNESRTTEREKNLRTVHARRSQSPSWRHAARDVQALARMNSSTFLSMRHFSEAAVLVCKQSACLGAQLRNNLLRNGISRDRAKLQCGLIGSTNWPCGLDNPKKNLARPTIHRRKHVVWHRLHQLLPCEFDSPLRALANFTSSPRALRRRSSSRPCRPNTPRTSKQTTVS